MTYRIKSKTTRTNDYNPIDHLISYAIKLEAKMRRKYKKKNIVIYDYPIPNKKYLSAFEIDVYSYDNISFNYLTHKQLVKEAIEALEGCGLYIEMVDEYSSFHEFIKDRDYSMDQEVNNKMSGMIYLSYIIFNEYISPTLKLQYEDKVRDYIEKNTKAKVIVKSL
ncbi:MAG: hypothetical protein AB9835_02150 [Eubacteriales bacterium]